MLVIAANPYKVLNFNLLLEMQMEWLMTRGCLKKLQVQLCVSDALPKHFEKSGYKATQARMAQLEGTLPHFA